MSQKASIRKYLRSENNVVGVQARYGERVACCWLRKDAHRSREGTENVASPPELYELELGWVELSGKQQDWRAE